MPQDHRRILELPLATRNLIISSVQITSLIDVVAELVKNSLDAQATHIRITFDFLKGYCSVQDDGIGILEEEFSQHGGLGNMYHTSKLQDHIGLYGRHGRFLASLSTVALLIVTSSTISAASARSTIIRNGQRIATEADLTALEAVDLTNQGTKVVVHNLFGNMPVRVKERLKRLDRRAELTKEIRRMQRALVAILLVVPRSMEIVLRGNCHSAMYPTKMKSHQNGLSQEIFDPGQVAALFSYLGAATNGEEWQTVSGETEEISIRAVFCRRPVPTRDAQFIFIGLESIDNHQLLDEINAVFDSSSFGIDPIDARLHRRYSMHGFDDSDDSSNEKTSFPSKGSTKNVDCWPMFAVKIETNSKTADALGFRNSTTGCRFLVGRVAEVLKNMAREFLKANLYAIAGCCRQKLRNRQVHSNIEESDKDSIKLNNTDSIWPRLRSANKKAAINILSGLPFTGRGDESFGTIMDSHRDQRDKEAKMVADTTACSDDVVQWMHPSTRQTFLLSTRTGMIRPDTQERHKLHLGSASNTTKGQRKLLQKTTRDARQAACDVSVFFKSTKTGERPISSLLRDDSGTKRHPESFVCGGTSVSGTIHTDATQTIHGDRLEDRISKSDLKAMRVLAQVDKKFILASVQDSRGDAGNVSNVLVLIDQHAADERIKLESLFAQICNPDLACLSNPVSFDITSREADRLRNLLGYLQSWGMYMTISEDQVLPRATVSVSRIPQLIAERCRVEPKLLIDSIRAEIWSTKQRVGTSTQSEDWLTRITSCPQGVLNMLISRACRTAIMFNDTLSREECLLVVQRLRECLFPFQCAHGRPSMTILARLDDHDLVVARPDREQPDFGRCWKTWIECE